MTSSSILSIQYPNNIMSKQFDIESVPEGLVLPGGLADVDSAWMTILLRDRGMLSATNEVVSMAERDVGMTAGYFSSIKKMNGTFKEETDCPKHFICKSWPPFEIMPEASIASFFIKDMKGYTRTFPEDQFLPRGAINVAVIIVRVHLFHLLTLPHQKLVNVCGGLKAYANFLEHIVQFDLYDFIKSCKEDEGAADANWGPPVPPRCSADMKINTKFLEVVDPPK